MQGCPERNTELSVCLPDTGRGVRPVLDRPSDSSPGVRRPRIPVPKEHPRLLGSRQELKNLAKERPQAYQRVVAVARQAGGDDYSAMISMALVCAIDERSSRWDRRRSSGP